MTSKEDILKKLWEPYREGKVEYITAEQTHAAMDAYAEAIAIGFGEWIEQNNYERSENNEAWTQPEYDGFKRPWPLNLTKMKVSFQLTMPNVGSWNGQWTGAGKKYYVVRTLFKTARDRSGATTKRVEELLKGQPEANFYYRWNDGWGANVKMEVVTAAEARKRIASSSGFCGYEWMIDSILKYGKILTENDIKKLEQSPVEV